MKKSNNTIALEVLCGKWGNGDKRKKELKKAGYDYNAIQKIVNDRMTKKPIDTVAHEVIDGLWGSGDTRKKCLTVAGYNYSKVQNRVNEMLEPKKYDGELPTVAQIKTASNAGMKKRGTAWAKKVAVDNRIGYMNWVPDDKVTHTCPFCTKRITYNEKTGKFEIHTSEKYAGANCIGMGAAYQHNGCGFPTTCNCSVVSQKTIDGKKNRFDIFEAKTDAEAVKLAQKKFNTKDLIVIREKRKGKTIPKSEWKEGDFCCRIDSNGEFNHVFTYIGGKKIFDDGGYNDRAKQCAIRSYDKFSARVIIRITYGRTYLSKGDEGVAVKMLQRYLNWYGNYVLDEDGIFGEMTESALVDFQAKEMGEADGLAGEKTFAKMAEIRR